MRLLLLFATAMLALTQTTARAEPLKVLYLERPPYYFTYQGHPSGFLWAMGDNVMRQAGFEPQYESIPPQRILSRMQDGDPACSVGWFQRPDRETYASFSAPIYRNRPMVLLHLWKNRARFAGIETVAELFAREDLVWGKVGSFAFNQRVEDLRETLHPKILEAAVSQGQMLGMLAVQRFDYMLISPEELDGIAMMKQAALGNLTLTAPGEETPPIGVSARRGDFATLLFEDMPPGPARRIMCTRTLGPAVIERLNKAIGEVLGGVE